MPQDNTNSLPSEDQIEEQEALVPDLGDPDSPAAPDESDSVELTDIPTPEDIKVDEDSTPPTVKKD